MKVKLIPVIEIGYNNQGIPVPDKYPYWDYPEIWDNFHALSHIKAGFKDLSQMYLPGSSFFRLSDITKTDLTKIVIDHTFDMRNDKYAREQESPFFGGYVLNIDNEDVYFPQCCGDLSDIRYWENLLEDKLSFYAGHPEPKVVTTKDHILFDFTTDEFDEHFVPTPKYLKVTIDKPELKKAIDTVKIELKYFADTLKDINIQEQLDLVDIDKLLIWGDN